MTPKQHLFAREIVLGKSQADAYRSAYNTLKMNDNSIRREASRLMDNPNVATTVVELQQKADTAVVQERIASREEVLQTLTGYMHSGEPKDSVRFRAAEVMGKLSRECMLLGPENQMASGIASMRGSAWSINY